MPVNRLVVLLTPLAATLAGAVSAWVAKNIPGVEISEGALNEIFIAGLGIAAAGSAHWLHGYQKWEQREAEATRSADVADDELMEVSSEDRSVIPPELEDPALDMDDDLLDEVGDPMLEDDLEGEDLEPVGAHENGL